MKTKISFTPWKKNRFPRKLKKKMVKERKWQFIKNLIRIANVGRFASYQLHKFWGVTS